MKQVRQRRLKTNRQGIKIFQLLYHGNCRERHWQDQGGCRWRSHLEAEEKEEGWDMGGNASFFFVFFQVTSL